MSTEVAVAERSSEQVPAVTAEIMEKVIVGGDLARLTPIQRVAFYRRVCESIGLNPLTKPLEYITLNGRLTLYVNKTATDQLRSLKGIHVDRAERDASDADYATWVVFGHDSTGRTDSEIGSVSIKGLIGEAKANAIMKALTKAKRRLTLSLAGLGWLDESEIGSIPGAHVVEVDAETGEIAGGSAAIADQAHAVAVDPGGASMPAPDLTQVAAEVFEGEVKEVADEPPQAPEKPAETPPADTTTGEVKKGLKRCPAMPEESALGMTQQCAREEGHSGAHKSREGSWPA